VNGTGATAVGRTAVRTIHIGHERFPSTVVDWARWPMYGDTAARDRLPAGAAGPRTRWEAQLG